MTNEYTPAVLVGIITPQQPEDRTREYLDELAFLADTNHIEPVKRFVQRLEYPNSTTSTTATVVALLSMLVVYRTHDLRHELGVVHPAGEALCSLTDGEDWHCSAGVTVARPAEMRLRIEYADGSP